MRGIDLTLFGFPVRILPTFLVVLALLGWGLGSLVLLALWVLLGVLAVLAHELGHAFAYRAFGVRPEIVLHGFGGLTLGRSLPTRQELAVSLAGPAVGLALGLPLLGLYASGAVGGDARLVLLLAVFVTLGWSLLNLLPILPLDGGHAVAAVLSLALRRDATQGVRWFSVVAAGGLAVLCIAAGEVYLALFAGILAFTNAQAAINAPKVTRPPRPRKTGPRRSAAADRPPPEDRRTVPPDNQDVPTPAQRRAPGSRRGLEDEFGSAAKAVLQGEPELALLAVARMRSFDLREGWLSVADQLEAWAWLQRGDLDAARALIERVPAGTVARRCLELGVRLTEQDGALREVPEQVAHLAATGAADAEPDGGGAVALSVLAAEVARRGGAGAIGERLRAGTSPDEAAGATRALSWLSERLRIAGLPDAAGLLDAG